MIVDGDSTGVEVVERLRRSFSPIWDESRFVTFAEPQFECYYPSEFAGQVSIALGTEGQQKRRQMKKELLTELVEWIRVDDERARAASRDSAADVIDRLIGIEAALDA